MSTTPTKTQPTKASDASPVFSPDAKSHVLISLKEDYEQAMGCLCVFPGIGRPGAEMFAVARRIRTYVEEMEARTTTMDDALKELDEEHIKKDARRLLHTLLLEEEITRQDARLKELEDQDPPASPAEEQDPPASPAEEQDPCSVCGATDETTEEVDVQQCVGCEKYFCDQCDPLVTPHDGSSSM